MHSLGFPLICLFLSVLRLRVHCGYIKMIMNKCIINSTSPSVELWNVATRGNKSIIVSLAFFCFSCVSGKKKKSNTKGLTQLSVWANFKRRRLCFRQPSF